MNVFLTSLLPTAFVSRHTSLLLSLAFPNLILQVQTLPRFSSALPCKHAKATCQRPV